jgi:preprotein translocase subunit Sss1
MTKIVMDFSSLRQTTWREYLKRFLMGGAITAIVGIIGSKFGPGIGGLFLAFPAIFPASATLIEKHELEKKGRAELSGVLRSRKVAAVDAAGAAIGCVGLVGFAVTVYKMLPVYPAGLALSVAVLIWMAVSVLLWRYHKAL